MTTPSIDYGDADELWNQLVSTLYCARGMANSAAAVAIIDRAVQAMALLRESTPMSEDPA